MSEEKKKKKIPFRTILIALLIAGIFVAGYQVRKFFTFSKELKIEQSSQALLERIEKVSKLITVEGYFSEIYDYKDYYWYDLSPFRKKALIRVKAKVSMGINFEGIDIETNEKSRTITLGPIPKVEILSIDHDSDYYDISEGTFNSFSEKDYNELQKNAKEYIRNIALESDLVSTAEEQRNELMELIRFYVESVGWTLVIVETRALQFAN